MPGKGRNRSTGIDEGGRTGREGGMMMMMGNEEYRSMNEWMRKGGMGVVKDEHSEKGMGEEEE